MDLTTLTFEELKEYATAVRDDYLTSVDPVDKLAYRAKYQKIQDEAGRRLDISLRKKGLAGDVMS